MRNILRLFYLDLFLGKRFFIAWAITAFLFLFSYFFPWLGMLPYVAALTTFLMVVIDILLLYAIRNGEVKASRSTPHQA